jgi:GH25 family lysozyme M1 (1,4-beta-N-acetylmuramidase)
MGGETPPINPANMTVDIKLPLIISTSGWQPNVTWVNSSIPISAAACRASLGISLKDNTFSKYWKQWEETGTPRLAYHYLKNAYSAADQSKFFLQCVNDAGGIKPGDKLCLDVEEEKNLSISAIIDWLYNVQIKTGVETKDLLIYSRAGILNPLSFKKLTAAQKKYLLEIQTWLAIYPDEPNLFNFQQLVDFAPVDTERYGKCAMVQYAASLVIDGIANMDAQGTECNVADPDYLKTWQESTASVNPPIEPPNGGTMFKVTSTSKVNIRSTGGGTLGTDIGDFMPGQVGYGTEVMGSPTGAYYSLKVTSGADVVGYVYARWNNNPTYATIAEMTPPAEFAWPDKLVAYHGSETKEYLPNA